MPSWSLTIQPHQEGHHATRRSRGSVEYFPTPNNHGPNSLAGGGPPCGHLHHWRDDKRALTTREPIESSSSAAARSTTTPRQLVSRLREILRIRESAYRSRNPDLLRSVYSSDCPCLASDEKAIYELLRRAYVWDGIETSVEIRRVTKLHERLWTVTALFRSETLRIETEDGKLVRKEPAGSDLFEFTLVKPRYAHRWLLGRASVVEG